jgi:hypothetical protein
LRSRAAHAARRLRDLTAGLRAAAGHGVHRPDSKRTRVGAAPSGRPRPRPVAQKQGAHAGAPLHEEPIGRFPAGHGVHRSDSAHHRDTEAQSDRVPQCLPSSSSSSVSLRLCGESLGSAATLSAGHGVHRSVRQHLRSSASIGAPGTRRAHA